ncbi:TIM barrel protein [Arthrobacter sp. zg-Y820]|uniref:bifunctional sugar phosphate isomerase/epimerase/4-hydroxyphenylpyruvate dioxygenase family protein n=1 Tax=unclassified Arthrobacter TaxID=235627 RepID=UPI001E2EB736|nr:MULTISPECIES: sugar phosphate isomerase/epimerase and 4-hydroxyphenylpyruvate domain-containing protein [unclassified Arthrobacter]MCC9196562.1 sugar phosphate isomerase/epimerase and 4-hydroxyphenylpyruvate domain-containing protein [Arthrobacter sp. zg-Y820]MDK1279424.1 TIM barrel protein [Arthrobacter sp. zg.Y820]MDK1358957.1 TIM barrel protein [Arthrobacter sp. zg-Y1219]WIB08195.1 TIM barrel protein [Arthrobacter sp. zg-Y820]
MRTSIATVCLSGTLEEKMRACAEAGFDGIEIFEQDLIVSPASPEEIRDLAARLGLSLDLFQPFRDFEGVSEDLLEDNLYRAEAKFELMNRLGIDTMLVCSNVATATVDDDDVAASQLRRMGELAARYGVRLAYEALAWGRFVNDFEHAQRIVDLADHPNVGTCLDSFHILSRRWDPAGIEKIPAEKIFFVQLADAPELSMDVLSWSRHYRVFPGEGAFDLTGFMAHLVRSGYDGPVSLEIFNDVFRQTAEQRTAVDAMRSLIWLGERTSVHLAEHDAAEHNPASRSYPMDLATLPAVAEPTGFNFAEVKAENTGAVEELLHQLGFRCEGRHRTKPVQLWSAGAARVIINQQQAKGMAPGISALGLDVQDPLAAASRAVQLKAVPVSRRSQADEAVLQAVSAPDSTEIFLCESTPDGTVAWAEEFGVPQDARESAAWGAGPAADGLITHVDHINLSQPWQHFDEAVLFYESTLSLVPRASQEVPSPMGLVRSQVMCSSDGRVRLALNIAPLALEGGGPDGGADYPQHVAFACSDVVSLARMARQRGLKFLPIPANYYEDLRARFRLDPDLLRTLQSLNLLYDRDGDGEFLHFYTATVGNVFFEVVERRRSYDGYGAPNAPVRLAAQYQRARRGGA